MDQINQPFIQQGPQLSYFNMGTEQRQDLPVNNSIHQSQLEQYHHMHQSQQGNPNLPQQTLPLVQQNDVNRLQQFQSPIFNDMESNQQQPINQERSSDIHQSHLSQQHLPMQLPFPHASINQLFPPHQDHSNRKELLRPTKHDPSPLSVKKKIKTLARRSGCDSNTQPSVTRSPSKSPGKIKTKTSSPRKPQLSKEERLKTPDKRFGGLTEEDVKKLLLPDHLAENLDIIFIGINPGLMSAYKGHHYCNPNNHFWPLLFDSGLIPEKLNHESDFRCLEFGIGMTNIVARTTRNAAELSRKEIADGKEACIEMIRRLKPLVLCFNGKGIYEIFSGGKCGTGRQADIFDTAVYVMPSTLDIVQ